MRREEGTCSVGKSEPSDDVGGLRIQKDFIQTAPPYYGNRTDRYDGSVAEQRGNNQTDAYLKMLQLPHRITTPYETRPVKDPNALDLDDLWCVCRKHEKTQ